VSSLGSRGSAGAYADLLLPGAGPAPARSPEPAGPPAPFPLPPLQLPPGREGGPSAAERRLEALTRELERALEARTARDYFGERAGRGGRSPRGEGASRGRSGDPGAPGSRPRFVSCQTSGFFPSVASSPSSPRTGVLAKGCAVPTALPTKSA
jgi:hypothetical protein